MNGANRSSRDNFIVRTVILFSLATIAFYLLTEHRAHLLAYSNYIIFLVFVLMHVFMHLGHGGHGGHDQGKHKHKDAEQKEIQNAGGYEDAGQYKRLAKSEEREVLAEFGEEYSHYMETVPRFIPRFR
jgi:protein-S-isoprenylcysteine O-methyltransferase Ste14